MTGVNGLIVSFAAPSCSQLRATEPAIWLGSVKELAMIDSRRLIVAAFALLAATPAQSQPQPDQEPLRIVRALYAPYVADRDTPGQGALDFIRPNATPELQRLIDREAACTRRTQGICAIDYDVLVDGQDYKITRLNVTAQDARPGAMTVRATFRNLGRPTVVDFPFVLTAGRWLISDVVIKDGNRRLTAILKTNR